MENHTQESFGTEPYEDEGKWWSGIRWVGLRGGEGVLKITLHQESTNFPNTQLGSNDGRLGVRRAIRSTFQTEDPNF
jgi:hypothetical protein